MTATASDVVTVNGKQYCNVREGLASVLAPYHGGNSNAPRKGHNNDEGVPGCVLQPHPAVQS